MNEFALDYSTHVFTITRINSRTSPRPGTMVYSLAFSSPEGLRDNRVRVSKSYTNTVDAIIEDVLSQINEYTDTERIVVIKSTVPPGTTAVSYTHLTLPTNREV